MIENINIEQITDVYLIPWAIKVTMAIVIFMTGQYVV